jgi:antibiotic biosynthesis monooxygenase (ABM) superfamily enzyme
VLDAEQRSPATVVIAQRMKHGRQDDVRCWQEDVNRAVAAFAGYVGNDVVASADADEWTVIYRFDSKPHLVSWLASPEREAVGGLAGRQHPAGHASDVGGDADRYRALRFWLTQKGGRGSARVDALGLLASVAFLAVAAAVFWACTTQIWHLP